MISNLLDANFNETHAGFMLPRMRALALGRTKILFCYIVNQHSPQTGPAAFDSFINLIKKANNGMDVLR